MKDGASIKILLVSEQKLTASLEDQTGTYYDWTHGLKITKQNLHWLFQHPENNGNIEVRFTNVEPKFNVIVIDPDNDNGNIFVGFYPIHWGSGRPRIELKKQRDSYWFQYFHDQFEAAWAESTPFMLDQFVEATDD